MSARTEAPTPRRLREARRQGNVARSRIAGTAGCMLGGGVALLAATWEGRARLLDWTVRVLTQPEVSVVQRWSEAQELFIRLSLPGCLGALLGAVAASVMVSAPQLNLGIVAPRLDRISLESGWGRIFSLRSLRELGKAMGVASVGSLVLVQGCIGRAPVWILAGRGPVQNAEGVAASVLSPLRGVLWVLAVLALVDIGLTRLRYRRDLMMTREEVRREYKDAEGDPRHKAKRRTLHRQLAASGPARGVAAATLIVVNPTHLAVALRYEPCEADAPYVVAKGREELAAEIRSEASALGIPITRDVPLARSLFRLGLGEELPEELYVAAAAALEIAWRRQRPERT